MMTGDVDTFNDRMAVSRVILQDIARDARRFALNEDVLASQVATLSAILVPKGLAGNNLSTSRDLSRNFLKSAPTLGVDPQLAEGQLLRALTGQASGGDTLFRRLSLETKAFRDFQKSIGSSTNIAQKFNQLKVEKRLDLIVRGMKQFSSDMDVLEAETNTFSRQLSVLRNLFVGFDGILLPLGRKLNTIFVNSMKEILKVVHKDFRRIVTLTSKFTNILGDNATDITTNLIQAQRLGKDVKLATKAYGFFAFFQLLGHFFPSLASSVPLLQGLIFLISAFGGALKGLFVILKAAGIANMQNTLFVVGFLVSILTGTLPLFIGLVAVLQLWSRITAKASVESAKEMPRVIANGLAVIDKFKIIVTGVLSPIGKLFDSIAQAAHPIFKTSNILQVLVQGFSILADVLHYISIPIVAVIDFLKWQFRLAENIMGQDYVGAFKTLKSLGSDTADYIDAYQSARLDALVGAKGKRFSVDGVVAKNTTNINKVEIKNEFKEKYEVDRIAFSITKQLLKVAQNPNEAKGGGYPYFATPDLGL